MTECDGLVPAKDQFRAADRFTGSGAGFLRPFQTRQHTFAETEALLLGDHREDGNHRVAKDPAGIQVRFGEGAEAHVGIIQPFQIYMRLVDALAAETVQGPEQEDVELALRGIHHQGLKLGALGFAAGFMVLVLAHNDPALRGAELAQLTKLVSGFLALVLGGDAAIESSPDGTPPREQSSTRLSFAAQFGLELAEIAPNGRLQNKRIFAWAEALEANGNPDQYQLIFYAPNGQRLGGYLINASFDGVSKVTLLVTSLNNHSYFGSRRLDTEDRLSSVGNYYPYGEEKGSSNPSNDNYKFATYWRDSLTGLDYADQRYYANQFGRFMTPDPYRATTESVNNPSDPDSWNKYAYVGGDPINRFDPVGNCWHQAPDLPPESCDMAGGGDTPPQRPKSDSDQPSRGGTWRARVDVTTNSKIRPIVVNRLATFQGSNCDKVFSKALKDYSFDTFYSAALDVNFYFAYTPSGGNSTDGSFTQDQVSGNGVNTTLRDTLPLGEAAVTIINGILAPVILDQAIINGPGLSNTLIHELLHSEFRVDDNALYTAFVQIRLGKPRRWNDQSHQRLDWNRLQLHTKTIACQHRLQ